MGGRIQQIGQFNGPAGIEQQIRVGAETFANLRAQNGSSADAPLSEQIEAVGKSWATDPNWAEGVKSIYSDMVNPYMVENCPGAKSGVGRLEQTQWGLDLARDAEANATGSGGWCYKYVAEAIARQGGGELWGGSAYMAADQLAQNENFEEVTGLTEEDLVNLPAGCVVVWDQGNGHPHGHILVSLGDGREASDVIRPMTQGYGTTFRVFQPAR